jgi:hypothetical protein
VYPAFLDRWPGNRCFPDLTEDQITTAHAIALRYYCPALITAIASDPTQRDQLFKEWSELWDMDKTYLIQKTPTFDIQFLDVMTPTPAVHTIIVRHPLEWHDLSVLGEGATQLDTLYIWLHVWAHTLNLLHSGAIKSFAVVNYEALVRYKSEITDTLGMQIQEDCLVTSSNDNGSSNNPRMGNSRHHHGRVRRRLELHDQGDLSEYRSMGDQALELQKHCQHDDQCRNLMEDLTPLIKEFGYHWPAEDSDFYQAPSSSSHILFSSASQKTIPNVSLVSQLNALVSKYQHKK